MDTRAAIQEVRVTQQTPGNLNGAHSNYRRAFNAWPTAPHALRHRDKPVRLLPRGIQETCQRVAKPPILTR